jgi:hypothetical protein
MGLIGWEIVPSYLEIFLEVAAALTFAAVFVIGFVELVTEHVDEGEE